MPPLLSDDIFSTQSAAPSAGRGVWIAVGCLSALFVGILVVVALGAAFLLWQGSDDGSGVGRSRVSKKDGEVIEYDTIEHAKRGPSVVAPSGRSGETLEKAHGVIHTSSNEIHKADEIEFPLSSSYCKDTGRVTDIPKSLIFELDRTLRDSTFLSDEEEQELGDKIAKEVRKSPKFKGKLDTPKTLKWRKYLSHIAQPFLAEVNRKGITYSFHVVDEPVVNAFAMPGGHIYFYTGLLEGTGGKVWAENEAQIATVMSHEISHVDLGHTTAVLQYLKQGGLLGSGAQQFAQIALFFARHPFSSNQEAEADEKGVEKMYLAQYSPQEAVAMWKLWQSNKDPKRKATKKGSKDILTKELENLIRSHPSSRKRACDVMRHSRTLLARDKFDRFYVGTTNLKRKKPRALKQY